MRSILYAINGSARGDIDPSRGSSPIARADAMLRIAQDSRFFGLSTTSMRVVYVETADGELHKAYQEVVSGNRGQDPALDNVYVDLDTGAIVAVYPQIGDHAHRYVCREQRWGAAAPQIRCSRITSP